MVGEDGVGGVGSGGVGVVGEGGLPQQDPFWQHAPLFFR